eukprot:6178000-Pleurochrysis_carterae.AAC.2
MGESGTPYIAFADNTTAKRKAEARASSGSEGSAAKGCCARIFCCLCGTREPQSRTIRLNAARPTRLRFPKNIVINTKYTLVSFVPKVLFEQFRYFFNLYFLLVAVSQFFPSLQIGLLVTYIAPLAFVLAVTMSKEAYDDLQRYRTDREINRELYTRLLPGGGTEAIRAQDLQVGAACGAFMRCMHLLELLTRIRP